LPFVLGNNIIYRSEPTSDNRMFFMSMHFKFIGDDFKDSFPGEGASTGMLLGKQLRLILRGIENVYVEDSESDEEEEGSAKEHIPDMEEEDDDKDLNDTLNAGEAEENSTFLPCGRAPQDILEFLHNERKGEGNTHEAKYFKHLFYLWEHNIPHLKDEAYVASCGMEDLREIHDYTLGNIIQGSKKSQQS